MDDKTSGKQIIMKNYFNFKTQKYKIEDIENFTKLKEIRSKKGQKTRRSCATMKPLNE